MTDGSSGEQWAERIEQLATEMATDASLSAAQHAGASEALHRACDALRATQHPAPAARRNTGMQLPRIGGGDPTAGVAIGRLRRRTTD